jgi:hypothetical protein
MLMPLLSESDPKESAEGSIDPLGMYAIADALAVKLVPGVRERQQHPRFLTHLAISLSLTAELEDRPIGVEFIEPWQVYEWYVVEGLVRRTTEKSELRGLPGQEKATKAIQDKVLLNASRYLKTPSVFGFHGIYRALSRDVGIEQAERLGDFGYELAKVWETEQNLEGFLGSGNGPGRVWRDKLSAAIEDGITAAAVARKPTWPEWEFFPKHLGIYKPGDKEAAMIAMALGNAEAGHRKDVLDVLLSPSGSDLWHAAEESRRRPEREFHQILKSAAPDSVGLNQLLEAIDVYEKFARLLQNAFDACLYEMSNPQRRVGLKRLAELLTVKLASEKIPELFDVVAERVQIVGKEFAFRDSFSSLSEPGKASDWAERLLQHHRRIQKSKPPAGKAAWFDRFDDGTYLIRTAYLKKEAPTSDDASYVHAYRTQSLWSFARDLRMLKS